MYKILIFLISLILICNILWWNNGALYVFFAISVFTIIFRGFLYKRIIKTPLLLKPIYFFTIFFITYYFIGCANLSIYRGTMKPFTILIIILSSIVFLMGSQLGRKIKVKKLNTKLNCHKLKIGINTLLFFSAGTAIFIILKYGFIFVGTYGKFYVRTYLLYFVLLATIPSIIYFTYVQYNDKRIGFTGFLFYFIVPILILMTGGYRGYVIFLLFALGISTYALSENTKRIKLLVYVVLSAVVLNTGFYIMRDINTYLMQTSALYATYDFNRAYLIIAPAHFAFRETIGLFQKILEVIPSKINFSYGKLLMSDFLTILPGKQEAGGFLIKDLIIGAQNVGGLTPSALGGLYFDFGYPGIFLGFLAMGIIAGYFYKKYEVNNNVANIVNLAFVYAVLMHYIHRGVLAPYYFFLFIVINFIFFR